jgi:energy-coupling factor transporter ATP-binding protein EcfA2/energy-coupling factor transporter transmembrane protein EcfT
VTPLAPSSKLAVYLAALVAVYLIRDPTVAIVTATALSVAAAVSARVGGVGIPASRWRALVFFAGWVFAMRLALDVAGGGSLHDSEMFRLATRQAARVAFLIVGALALIATTPARAVVEELETTRLPRSMRLLVMMVVQYPRVLRDRYEQIVEAQVARGADRPRTILQRIAHGSRILLPVMQSELNAIGERAGLIHLRGLDVDVPTPGSVRVRTVNPAMGQVLRFVDYGFTYSIGDAPALSHVNLDLLPGRITCVIAPQGAGKTTLLRAAAGLLGEIYQGEVKGALEFSTEGQAPTPSFHSGRQQTAAFFDGYVQVTLAVETVREEIGLPLFAFGLDRAERDARVVAVAHELGIEYLLDRQVTELSGGEEKLVGIAAALVPDVAIHVLDEPFEQLDVAHLAAVIRAAKLRARAGRLVLVATGALDIALNIADSAILFDDGHWTTVESPSYATAARVASLGESPVMHFLSEHHAAPDGVRLFRDAVRRAS